jgi:O-antigen ligase
MYSAKTAADINSRNTNTAKSSWIRLPLLVWLGMMLGVMVAYLISQGNGFIAVALVVLVPLAVLLSAHPFSGVLIWLLVMPFVSVLPNASLVFWVIYRLLPPFILCLAILSRVFGRREHPPVRLVPPELSMGVLALIVPGSILLFQTDSKLALIHFADRMILPFCMYFIIRLTAPRTKEIIQLQWVALFIAFSQSFIGFLSWYAPQILPEPWHYLQGYRTTGSLKDPDLYALSLIFSAAILIHGAVNHRSGFIRTIFLLATSLCFAFTFLSLERAAWLGLVIVVIGLAVLYPKPVFRVLIIDSMVIAILGAGILFTHIPLLVNRLSESDPIYARIVIFDAMSKMIQIKPVLGWGYETLDQNIQQFYHRVGDASIVIRLITSHNTYMTILTELGLVGFALYMSPIVWWFILSMRVWRRMPKEGLWSRSLLATLWLVMLFNFTVSNFMDMRFFEIGLTLWWITLGLIANMVYPYLKNRGIKLSPHIRVKEGYG